MLKTFEKSCKSRQKIQKNVKNFLKCHSNVVNGMKSAENFIKNYCKCRYDGEKFDETVQNIIKRIEMRKKIMNMS